MNSALVIIPTYNEKENVRPIASAVMAVSAELDILFVDDNSPDGTGDILDEMRAEDARIQVLHRRDKQGLGRAYIAGFHWALERDYKFIFEMDADFSHDPAAIPHFLSAMADADLALGTRYLGGIRVINWPLARLILSQSAGLYVRMITGMPFTDPTGGYKCFRREVLERIDLDRITSNGYSFQIEMTHTAWMLGFRIAEVPITFEERRSGNSKMSSEIVREALRMVWKLFFKAGGRRRPRSDGRKPGGAV
ncbi:MAG: polyprenol monophosphomannose synthase [Verrucomicrobia bacterium]|nr:polyprenol monophosphomannose synthase [Verrucomicrobiota bacterium]